MLKEVGVRTKAAERGSLFVRIWRSSTDGVPAFFSYGITVVRYWKKEQQVRQAGRYSHKKTISYSKNRQ